MADGQLQPGHRRRARDHAARGGEVRLQHLRQARPARQRAASPAACWPCCCTCAPDAFAHHRQRVGRTSTGQKPAPCGSPACRLGAPPPGCEIRFVPSAPLPESSCEPESSSASPGPTQPRGPPHGVDRRRAARHEEPRGPHGPLERHPPHEGGADLGALRRRGDRRRRHAPDLADRQVRAQRRRGRPGPTPSSKSSFDVEEEGLGEFVLVQSDTLTADDPAFKAAVADVERAVSRLRRR